MNNILSVELMEAKLIATLPQHDQFYRPLTCHLTPDNINATLKETNDGSVITPGRLSDVASSIIFPSTAPEQRVNIPNGLIQKRYVFILTLKIIVQNKVEYEVIKGYTEFDGISKNGYIDPDMKFYVNTVDLYKAPDNIPVPVAIANHSMLTPVKNYKMAQALRPEDVICNRHSAHITMHNEYIYDDRTLLLGKGQLSPDNYTLPAHYLSKACNSYIRGADTNGISLTDDYGITDPESSFYYKAYDNARTKSSELCYFYNALQAVRPYTSTDGAYIFTYGQLNSIWPRPDGFWITTMQSPNSKMPTPLEYTNVWSGANMETTVAYSLTHMFPPLLTKYGFTMFEVIISNKFLGNELRITPMNYASTFPYSPESIKPIINYIIGQIELNIVHSLLMQKSTIFEIHAQIDLTANSVFTISLDNQPSIVYNAPMFCDSYFSPLIGLEPNTLNELSFGIEKLTEALTSKYQNPWSPHTDFLPPLLTHNSGYNEFDNNHEDTSDYTESSGIISNIPTNHKLRNSI